MIKVVINTTQNEPSSSRLALSITDEREEGIGPVTSRPALTGWRGPVTSEVAQAPVQLSTVGGGPA